MGARQLLVLHLCLLADASDFSCDGIYIQKIGRIG